MNCRHCQTPLIHTFIDLGFAPPSNAYLTKSDLSQPESYYPLRVKVCDNCWLVQTEDYAKADALFSPDYAYFSSTSQSWLTHAKQFANSIIDELSLDASSFVIEVASNDGYLLKNFLNNGVPCLGIEPTQSTANAAEALGIPVIREFFGADLGERLAGEGKTADLIVGNNVFAHVPNVNDFTRGLKACLKEGGTITLEFPHLMRLIEYTQFDTIYHEHFSYFSLHTVGRILESAGLKICHVEELPTHGGSLRVFVCHHDDPRARQSSVLLILNQEREMGMQELETYLSFQSRANKVKNDFLSFLIDKKHAGKKVVAYGAAAKGNTILNYAGVKPDLLPLVFDAAEAKQNKYMPGSHIPILAAKEIANAKADYVVILPWNIAAEVKAQNHDLEKSGVQFVTAVPALRVH